MAAVLRAPGRAAPLRHGVRGHAVGRCRAPGLHRVPHGVVAELPHLRDHARSAGAHRSPSELGSGLAKLHVPVSRAAAGGGDGEPHGWARPRLAPGAPVAHPGTGRGRAAVRGRDGADAPRPRAAGSGGHRVPPGRPHRDAGGPRDAACAHRRAPRWARAGGTAADPGRVRARQDLHTARDRCPHPLLRRAIGLAPRLARPQGGAVAPGRSPFARARPVRLPPGTS